jgi:acyl-CoA thioester hydrolase
MSTAAPVPSNGVLLGNEHWFAVRVYIEDTDLGGVVYYANYLKFLERARSDLLRVLGMDHREAIEKRVGVYAVVEVNIKYRKPAKLDDDLLIVSRLALLRGVSLAIDQKVLRGEELLAEATVTVAFLSAEGRPKRQPDEWLARFQTLLSTAQKHAID